MTSIHRLFIALAAVLCMGAVGMASVSAEGETPAEHQGQYEEGNQISGDCC